MPTFGSLFSGIGGLDLGLERAGWRCLWQSEIDPYACRVLAKHWPNVPNLGDVKAIEWSTIERPDLIAGGYPCQPFSFAGGRAGADDARHLWPYFADALRLLRPQWALLENVPGHLGLGFDAVLSDLAALGFDAEWEMLPAAAFGAPHLRYRLFVVAHAKGKSEPRLAVDAEPGQGVMVPDAHGEQLRVRAGGVPASSRAGEGEGEERERVRADAGHVREAVADADSEARTATRPASQEVFRPGPEQRPGRRGGSVGDEWATEPDVGRVADGVPARLDRLRGLGNAVVPQVAEWIGRRLMEVA